MLDSFCECLHEPNASASFASFADAAAIECPGRASCCIEQPLQQLWGVVLPDWGLGWCRATDVQVEFVMLDPYVRHTLSPSANVGAVLRCPSCRCSLYLCLP